MVVSGPTRVYPARMGNKAPDKDRTLDIVVWGATGFTGRLVVEYLSRRYSKDRSIRWGVAGRNLQELRRVVADPARAGADIPVIVADSNDLDSLRKLAQSAKVVLTTVGPYARWGSNLVQACVENGTHYCDLAGEVQWMRAMIDRYQSEAETSGARIVHSCGFDSIPSDIGVYLMQEYAIREHKSPCASISLYVRAMKGGASGGTFASMLTAIEQAREDRNIARILADPYALNPEGSRSGQDGRDQTRPEFDEHQGVWTAPFVMAAVNTRVVRRTNALLQYRYGRNFRYSEATISGRGAKGWCKSAATTTALAAFLLASSNSFTRKQVVERLVPAPGEGPNERERAQGFFNLRLIGKLADGNSIRMTVAGDRDPGYGSTSKMLTESAICLAKANLRIGGGFWTPASAMGDEIATRLSTNAGVKFEIQ